MPGYNHYLDCSCGWCDKSGFGYFDRAGARSLYDTYAAAQFLKRNLADRGRAACFVNPNARCPECGAAVFFYSNSFGSRVFFDDLGPPWPKHPCTDALNGAGTQGVRPEPITKRPRGITLELVEASQRLDPTKDPRSGDWALAYIFEIERVGFRNKACCNLLESFNDQIAYISFDSSEEVAKVGDVVALRLQELSIFDPRKMQPKVYKVIAFEDDKFITPRRDKPNPNR